MFQTRLTADGKTFSGLPMTYYVPEYKQHEIFENSYHLAPKRKFNGWLNTPILT